MADTMSWEEVTQSYGFKDQSPTQKYNMQLDYFDDVVAPVLQENGAAPDDIKVKFKEFFTEHPPAPGFEPTYFPKHLKDVIKLEKKKISDTDVDFERSVKHLPFQIAYERAKGTQEKNAVFEKYGMGPDDVRPLQRGGHALKPSGMEKLGLQHHGADTAVVPPSMNMFEPNTIAKMTVEGPKIAAEVGAGMVGARHGLLGGAALTGSTGLGVEAADETIKHLQGLQKRGKGEISGSILSRGATAPLADTGVRVLQPTARKLALGPQATGGRMRDAIGFGKLKPHESPLDPAYPTVGRAMEPDAIARTEGALDQGFFPMIKRAGETSRFPVTNLVGSGQEVLNRLLGDPTQFINSQKAEMLADALTKKAGGSWRGGVSESEFGKTLGKAEIRGGIQKQKTIAQLLLDADKVVNKSIKDLQKSNPLADNIYESLSGEIKQHKSKFSSDMSQRLNFLDQKNANAKTISSTPIQRMIQEWSDDFPDAIKIVDGEVIEQGKAWMSPEMKQYLNEAMNMEDTISFRQLHNLRTIFSASAYDDGLVKTVGNHRAGVMKNLLDEMAESSPALSNKLKKFNADYKAGMDKYDDNVILSLAKEGKDRVPLNKVADRLLDMDKKTATNLKMILPKKSWDSMSNQLFDDVVQRSKNIATDDIEPGIMLENIKRLKNNGTYYALYGEKRGNDILSKLKELESRGWAGNAEELMKRDTDVSAILQRAIAQQQELDTYMKQNFMKVLTGPNPEKAMQWALYNQEQAKQMMEHIGNNEQTVGKARQLVLKRGMSKMLTKKKGSVTPVLDGPTISNFVTKFEEMPENPAKTILGPALWKDLKTLGESMELTQYKAGGALEAASKGMSFITHPLKNLPPTLKLGIVSRLLSNPSFVRYMSTGLKEGVGGAFGAGNRQAMGSFFRTMSQAVMEAARTEGYTPPELSPEYNLSDSQVYQELMK
jgi:hypothetical protein